MGVRRANFLTVDLIRIDPAWSPLVRGAQGGFAGLGVLLVFLVTFIAMVEITTSPAFSPLAAGAWSAGVVAEAVHLFLLARNPRSPSVWSWIFFAAALSLMVASTWGLVRDPDARALFAAMAMIGGLWLGASRLLNLGFGAWASSRRWAGAAALAVAWLPLEIPVLLAGIALFP